MLRPPQVFKQKLTRLSAELVKPFLQVLQGLYQKNQAFLAGLQYMDTQEYDDACQAFEQAKAYKHLIVANAKKGYYEQAFLLADQKKYYALGAKIAIHHHDLKQAAYFYSYFDPLHAARLYRELNCYYEAGFAFLAGYDPIDAIDMFRHCRKNWQKEAGFKQVAEFALVLYLQHAYETAFKLFMSLDDYYSALECAKALHDQDLIKGCALLISLSEAEKEHFIFAAQCIEPYQPELAGCYYALGGNYEKQIGLLIGQGEYHKALKVCLIHHNLNRAYQIASTYNPELLSS